MAKQVWEKKNPKQTSKQLSPSQKSDAMQQAKQHGRSTPSLVDNINASKGRTGGKQSGKKKSGSKK